MLEKVDFDHATEYRTAKNLYEMMVGGSIVIDEDMQRQYVWTPDIASKFIESIIFKLPVPPIIVEKRGDRWLVIDGVQRLTTIQLFYQNKLELRGVLHRELEGKRYKDLKSTYIKRLDELSSLPVMIVTIRAPDERYRLFAVLEVFRRLNQGAIRLTFAQVVFCSVPTYAVKVVKEVARMELTGRIFAFTPKEIKKMTHYSTVLLMMATMQFNTPVISRTGFAAEALKFLLNKQEDVERYRKELLELLQIFEAAGLTREYFVPGTYKLSASKVLSKNLVVILTHAFAMLKRAGLSRELAMKNAQKIRNTIARILNKDSEIEYEGTKKKVAAVYSEVCHKRSTKAAKALSTAIARAVATELGLKLV